MSRANIQRSAQCLSLPPGGITPSLFFRRLRRLVMLKRLACQVHPAASLSVCRKTSHIVLNPCLGPQIDVSLLAPPQPTSTVTTIWPPSISQPVAVEQRPENRLPRAFRQGPPVGECHPRVVRTGNEDHSTSRSQGRWEPSRGHRERRRATTPTGDRPSL